MARSAILVGVFGLSLLGASAAGAEDLTLTSPDIKEGATIVNEQVFKGFGCTGNNVSPALSWSGAPAATKSFAVTVYDPDAPTGSGFWHWVVFNVPASVTSFPKGAGDTKKKLLPKGAIQSRTDFGSDGYGGPCPPSGDKPHHYQITVFAGEIDRDRHVRPLIVGASRQRSELANDAVSVDHRERETNRIGSAVSRRLTHPSHSPAPRRSGHPAPASG